MSGLSGRSRALGAVVGAAVGAIGRVIAMALHVSGGTDGMALVLLAAGLVGAIVGALASLPGRPLVGAVIGAVLSGLFYQSALPAVWLLHMLGAVTVPSLVGMMALGALAGWTGGMVARHAARRDVLRSTGVPTLS